MTDTRKIPISTAKAIAEQEGLRQVLLIGWDGQSTHIVTYGKTKADCRLAAQAQDFWKGKIREFSFTEDIASLTDQLASAQARVKELESSFDLRWKADMRAIKMWCEETGELLTCPDHADLVVWLLGRLDALKDKGGEG